MYLFVSYVETPSNVHRVVTTFGEATHVMKPGPGFIWLGIQNFYDYDKRKFVINLKAEKIFTGKVKGPHDIKAHDEMSIDIDSTVMFDFSKCSEEDMIDVFNNGLSPSAGHILSNDVVEEKKRVTEFVQDFVHAIQSDSVGENSYRQILFYKGEFSQAIQTILREFKSKDRINPFKVLHVDETLTYIITKVSPPEDFVNALPMKAIEDQRGEGIKAAAEHKRDADKFALDLIDEHPNAASLQVMMTQAEKGKATFFIPTNIADGLGNIARKIIGE